MIYHNEQSWSEMPETEKQKIYGEFQSLRATLQAKGQYLGGSQLLPAATATSVRIRDDKGLVTDGPFAETHEALGGYFLVEVNNADEAIAIAKQIPLSRTGTIEVRGLVERPATANA